MIASRHRTKLKPLLNRALALKDSDRPTRSFLEQSDDARSIAKVRNTSGRSELTLELQMLSHAERRALMALWDEYLTEKIKPVMELLANMGDTEPAVNEFRSAAFAGYSFLDRDAGTILDIAHAADAQLLSLRDQLRRVWDRQDGFQSILEEWWTSAPLSDSSSWLIIYPMGVFFPTPKNTLALMARVCFEQSQSLKNCPACNGKFFIDKRGKYCFGDERCRKYPNLIANRKLRQKRKKKERSK